MRQTPSRDRSPLLCQPLLTPRAVLPILANPMESSFPKCVLACAMVAALISAGGLHAQNFAQPSYQSSSPQIGVLLLSHGQVVTGEITRNGDFYSVLVDHGEIRLPAREVECVCRTLEEVYERKRLRISADSVRDHLDLAQWCQKNCLFAQSLRELGEAAALNPSHPLIPVIERQIRMSAEGLPGDPNMTASDEGADISPTSDELDRLVRGMPDGAVQMFTETIQPLLTNNCTASGCHGPTGDSSFRLLRIPNGRPPSRRLTQRNIHAVIKQIDWENYEKSPLLTAPLRAHGTARAPVFTDRYSGKYQQLLAWTQFLVQGEKPLVSESAAVSPADYTVPLQPASAVAPTAFTEPILPSGLDVSQAAFESSLPAASGSPMGETLGDAIEAGRTEQGNVAAPRSQVKRGGFPPEFLPADPFDPEIFNRRFFPHAAPVSRTHTE